MNSTTSESNSTARCIAPPCVELPCQGIAGQAGESLRPFGLQTLGPLVKMYAHLGKIAKRFQPVINLVLFSAMGAEKSARGYLRVGQGPGKARGRLSSYDSRGEEQTPLFPLMKAAKSAVVCAGVGRRCHEVNCRRVYHTRGIRCLVATM
jgi:hypothetical protein